MIARGTALALVALMALMALSAVGCVPPRRTLGDQCELASDCAAPLSCSLGYCRNTCAQSRDCDLGLTCVREPSGLGVCLLPPETRCARDDECPASLVCRMGRCANACAEDRDCPRGARCEAVDGEPTCVDEGEGRCVDDIDCEAPRICGPFERCVVECVEDRDCRDGGCLGGRCVGAEPCRLDEDCDDGDFCNGVERCDAAAPGADPRGCAPAERGPCGDGEICDAETRACVDRCERSPDLDGDGVEAVACGGGDCDDDDPSVSPSADERCNGRDDDCDEGVDEGFDPSSDPANCGGCGRACSASGGTPRCVDGRCETACASGFADCNGDPADGCETDLTSDPLSCDGCGAVCPLARACESSTCVASPIVEVAAGARYTCARREAGGVVCWGANDRGQLGDGTTTASPRPVAVAGLVDAVAIAVGDDHACALRAGGRVVCWGANDAGQLGDGTTTDRGAPVRARAPASVVALGAGRRHTCVRTSDGVTGCWGDDGAGQLGGGGPRTMASAVAGLERTDALVVGQAASCERPVSGALRCVGEVAGVTLSEAAPIDGTEGLEGLALGDRHACGLSSGALRCWGAYDGGDRRPSPEAPPGASGRAFVDVAVGRRDAHALTCALDDAGGVACIGAAFAGQLGDGGPCDAAATTLVDVAGVGGAGDVAVDVAVGDAHACAALADGSVRCWGLDDEGQLGDGTPDDPTACRSTPAAVEGLP